MHEHTLPRSVPPWLGDVLDEALDACAEHAGLNWIHGQGSVISGFTTDSDVDLVAVWQTLPDRAVIQGATRVVLDDLVLEKARCVNHDLDVMHLPLSGFSSWVDAVQTGRTWRSSAWPDLLYAVAGLAHGLVVHDPSGEAARLQSRLSRSAPMFVKAVRDGVRQALPDYLRAAGRHDPRRPLAAPEAAP